MRNGLKIFEADAHVVEPENLWDDAVDSKSFPESHMPQSFEEVVA